MYTLSDYKRIAACVALGALMIVGLATGRMIPIPAASADGGVESTTEVPAWMTRVCESRWSVNCHRVLADGSAVYVRQMPGSTGTVCEIYADHPRRDYCA